ncbi:MAG: NAD(P)/FAD-dependent oxidoreductase [Myxococcota bacterium]
MEVRIHIERAHTLGFPEGDPSPWVADALGVGPDHVRAAHLRQRALDARKGRRVPTWQLTVDADISPEAAATTRHPTQPIPTPPPLLESPCFSRDMGPVVVVGAGPAGLFAALHLAEHGARVVLVERGKPVETRARDFGRFRGRGELDPDSNLCFGEGGAGTYSDGKLTCRRKDPLRTKVLERLHRLGGPEQILVDAKPHIGTNFLFRILKNARRALVELGVQHEFSSKMVDVRMRGSRVVGIRLEDGRELDASAVILAMGHSARELFFALAERGLPMESKGFAVGVRIEHPQRWLDGVQYRLEPSQTRPATLPPADYRLAHTVGSRGVYSFCMCPGGMVVPTATEPESVVVNGMSSAKRGSPFANSGLVVQVNPDDVEALGFGSDPLAGLRFQRALEREAFAHGGRNYRAPAMKARDFVRRKTSIDVADSHFRPGLTPADLRAFLPSFIQEAMQEALRHFDRFLPGYASDHANLIAVESRTSSPLRILRDPDHRAVVGWPGLYVAGEGPGYAGGIMSAALDGLRVADSVLRTAPRPRPSASRRLEER